MNGRSTALLLIAVGVQSARKAQITPAIIEAKAARAAECIGLSGAANGFPDPGALGTANAATLPVEVRA